jgi:glycerol-3-phosphate dehydrogenase
MTDLIQQSRHARHAQLADTSFDVLVIGGGIVGSGIARDAAMRGLRTALVDRHDFAFGTSSRSSRLLHGGLRYLEQGRIGLVREASVEKKILHRIAPHLAQPLGFVFPSYQPQGRPLWQLRVGVKLYDLLCSGRNFAASRGFTRDETLRDLPALNPQGLRGSVRYFDALTNDARLVLDTLRSAARHGAVVSNYVRFHDAAREGAGWQCVVEDVLAGKTFSVRARTIVNATGPWAHQLPHSGVKLRLSKGIHLVVDRSHLPVSDAVVMTEGKRILFLIPWGERLIIGTTDTDYVGAPEAVTTEAADVDYVLRAVRAAFPEVRLGAGDIISAWAGVRPLIANPDGSPSDISRAHEIRSPETGWWDVSGGKLTTYRLMAEQTVDRLVETLGFPASDCRTAREPLLGEAGADGGFSGILPAPFAPEAVEHFVREEWATSLSDVLVRRSGWHYYFADIDARAETVASWLAPLADWSSSRRETELVRYRTGAGHTHAWAGRPSPPAFHGATAAPSHR